MRKAYLIFFLFLFFSFQSNSQTYKLFETKDWIGCGEVYGIKNDKEGFMWFLTNEGIKKYDGKLLLNYKLFVNNKAIPLFPSYYKIFTDNKKNLWVVSKNGYIFKYSNLKDRFELAFNLSSLSKEKNINLSFVFLDSNDKIWLCNDNKQYIYNTKNSRITFINNFIKGEVKNITEITPDHKYILSSKNDIYSFKISGNKLTNFSKRDIHNSSNIIYSYYHKNSGYIIFCTKDRGIFLYNIKKKNIYNIKQSFINIDINTIKEHPTDKNSILIATNGSGMYRLDVTNKNLSHVYNNYIKDNYNISNNIIKDFLFDNDNTLWISVFPYGVLKYTDKEKEISTYKHSIYNLNSLVNDQVNNIIEDSDGDYWFITNNGISIYNKKRGIWNNSLCCSSGNDFINYAFKSVCEIKKGLFLISGYMFGACIIDKKDLLSRNLCIKDLSKKIISSDSKINSIFKDNENTIWIGDNEHLMKYNFTQNRIIKYPIENPITCISSNDKNSLLIGTINGLYKFNKHEEKIQKIEIPYEPLYVNSICYCPNKNTYVGTYNNGIFILNNKEQYIKNLNFNNSAIVSNNISGMLTTKAGNIILSSDKGISLFNTSRDLFINRSKEHGLSTDIFNPQAALKTKDNNYIFGSNEGAIEINESIFLKEKMKSKLVFNNFSIFYNEITPGSKNSPLETSINDCNHITLNHNQNMFSLRVSSINYNNQSNILYTWKLEGFYDNWSHPGKYDIIKYTNIPSGDYKLRVRAILLDNFKILDEKDLFITIKPSIWQSNIAYLIYLIIIALISYSAYKIIKIRRQRDDYNNKINFFINTAHDIKTPLTLIKSPLEEIIKKEKLSESGLTNAKIALRNTMSLSSLSCNLIDFEKEKYFSSLTVSKYNLKDYILGYMSYIKDNYKDKNIKINIKDYSDNINIYINKNKIDSILNNIISNAIKYSNEKGIIDVLIDNDMKNWKIEISDQGIGIDKNDQKKMFKYIFRGNNATNMRISGSGIGMLYTYKLIKNHHGTISCYSTLNKGTKFILTFPINDKQYNIVENTIPSSNSYISNSIKINNKRNKEIFDVENALRTKKTLLIVEDNIDLCNFLKEALSSEYNIKIAYNGEDALESINREMPDLIISDLMMPVMNGNILCNKIKNNIETCHIPIIILTALSEKENILKGFEIKADAYLVKPFDLDILKANISNIIENRHLINSAFSKNNSNFAGETDNKEELTPDQEFLVKVVSIIKEKINKDMNVDFLCRELNMSRTSFYNKIKALTDCSPSDFIRNIKMEEACKLLKSKRYSISEVADLVGFTDPKYFTDIFKRYYQMTPSEYMKQN